ncbi:MAG: SRPBCC family protein [Actinoplanes sp.]
MIDVKQQINAVRRTIGSRTLEAGEARVSTISQVYDTDRADLWTVVTDPDRIARWFLPVTGDLKEGGHYQLTGNAGGAITRCDEPHGYDATWEYGGMVSWIEVRLTEEEGGTRFELVHIGHVADELWDEYGPGATGIGWDQGLLGLAGYLSDPAAAITPENALTWMLSDEGKELTRLSSDAWAAAAIAAGDDPYDARRRADTCYGAYTAES